MTSELHPELSNNRLCCLPVDLYYFKEIGPVIHHEHECLLSKNKQIGTNFFAKGTRVACVAEAPRGPVPGGMFGRLYNEKQSLISALIRGHSEHILQHRCGCSGAGLTCPFEGPGTTSCSPQNTRPCDSISSSSGLKFYFLLWEDLCDQV